jgi:hypothetical protein
VGSTVTVNRRALVAVGMVMLAATAGFAGVAQAEMEHGHPGDTAGILPPGDWTEEQVDFAADLVHRTEAALPDHMTRDELTARGYTDFSTPATPWDHWTNDAYKNDGRLLDPEAPETLVLRTTPEGYQVVAAMFQLPPGSTMADIPPDVAWLPGWHEHTDVCFGDDNKFAGLATNGVCSRGHLLITTPMLHVWTVDNYCGHRFPGVGAGLMCEGHTAGEHPGTIPPGTGPQGTRPRPVVDPPPVRPTTTTTRPPGATTLPAQPVTATPHYAG